ncbi:MAG: UvrD-helicase domain-containing protein [Clostridia bacterium]|nr:UvrD-helicase domain-containing protein [Clostridia bacterium]
MDILKDLNEEQLAAVETIDGCVRVIAGAGSGKTRALAHRFAFLVNEVGVMPSNIMCVTFTNKAANEMKKRIRRLIGDNDCGYVCTFHGFCVALLKEDGHYIHYPQSFVILDSEDTDAVLKDIYEENGFTLRDAPIARIKDHIGYCKCKKYPDYYTYLIDSDMNKALERYKTELDTSDKIFWAFVYYQRRLLAIDYDDLINLSLFILSDNNEIRLKWQKRLEYIMVDEFQDIDVQQYSLVRILSAYHNNLFVVGDPDQTIYTWRGANIRFINDFDKEFKDTKTIILNKNYRSSTDILDVSNSLIKNNVERIPKELVSVKGRDIPVEYNHAKTSELEAKWIADTIKELVKNGAQYSDIAILYRAHYLTRPIEEVFIKDKIVYTLYSGIQFYARKEIKDVLSYLRLAVYKDDLSFKRIVNVPKRNIGKAKMQIITKYALQNNCTLYSALVDLAESDVFKGSKAKEFVELIEKYSTEYRELSLIDFIARLLNDSGYEEYLRTEGEQDRLDNLAELKKSINDFEFTYGEELTAEDYLQSIALYTNADVKQNANSVKMMTIHTAKGLEFPYVFVAGMSEGIFPSKKTKDRAGMEEERRLAYVAFTRAEKGLYITDAEGYNIDGGFRYPSRFIFNIEKKCLKYINELDPALVGEANAFISQSERELDFDKNNLPFKAGDRIVHRIMGAGTILDVLLDENVYLIKFDKLTAEKRINIKVPLSVG